jgi:GMP synthase (glutamine-hydrolysing)
MAQERGFLVLDFGSQLTQLIARRLRELNYYSEIHPYNMPIEKIKSMNPYGIILSGGPSSVYEKNAPLRNVTELTQSWPVLGICYGMQLLARELGGEVEASSHREYGFNQVKWTSPLAKVPALQSVWMSHGDIVKRVPPGFEVVGMSEGGHPAAMRAKSVWGVQFHPEVAHTQDGIEILKSFASELCQAPALWKSAHIVEHLQKAVNEKVGPSDHVLVGLSGGVDSSVVATLLTKTLGAERVHCVFVNNGLLRKNEYEEVMAQYKAVGLNVKGVDATSDFLSALKGLTDPEQKRKAIGRVFIEIFEKQLKPGVPVRFLGQGTLYPDVIESVSFHGGPSQTIKSHHNVGGLPERMKLGLVEPLRELFKDEVRLLGKSLGLPDLMLGRHPFPGPGLGIRIIGEVNEKSLHISREADAIFISKLREHNLYHKIWQAFCVLLPVQTVGVQGDGRTYDQVLALRAVTSLDGMTADWYPFEFQFLREVSSEITNKVKGVSRVVYDITSKPPATIEWE